MQDNIDNSRIFDLCDAREKRFLLDLMQAKNPDVVDDHPLPELHALLRAIEHMWGGTDAKQLTVPSKLIYYLAVCAAYAHDVREDVEGYRSGGAHDVHHILQGFMASVALAIKAGSVKKHEDGRVTIDLFRVPQWYYEEVESRRKE